MRIGIVGARIAGSYAALLLSRIGHEVILLDHSLAREKPCGGGVTPKALRTVAWFREQSLPHNEIRTLRLSTPDGRLADVSLANPIYIFSRTTLDTALRDTAIRSGVRFLPHRAVKYEANGKGWTIKAASETHEVDFLIGADGATSLVRSTVAQKFRASDLSLALGFYLPGRHHADTIITAFQEAGFLGYLWSFPRVDHSSIGILRRLPETNAAELRRRVLDFISSRYPNVSDSLQFYAARIPCLSRHTLVTQRVCGTNWALVGDAAGFVDPITSEGIYFAFRSAEILARTVSEGAPEAYEREWRRDFGRDLVRAAAWRDRFFAGTFLLKAVTSRAVQMLRRSSTVRRLTDGLITGSQTYERLRHQLITGSPRILVEALRSKLTSP